MVSIDQYAEAALGNRQYFLNRPHGIGGKKSEIPLGRPYRVIWEAGTIGCESRLSDVHPWRD
jgi:hypothetical protein